MVRETNHAKNVIADQSDEIKWLQAILKKVEVGFSIAERSKAFVEKALRKATTAKDEVVARANFVEAKLGVLSIEKKSAT